MSGVRAQLCLPVVERGLCLLVAASVVACLWRLWVFGYLPQPFFYATDDTFMDGFNTAFWANNSGAYDNWGSVYPPLTFVFLKLTTLHHCYALNSVLGRDCDWLLKAVMAGIYALNGVLAYRIFSVADRSSARRRTIALILGLPMLYAAERLNVIIPCFTAFMLGYSDLLKSKWGRALSAALALNFKPYLLVTVLPWLAARRISWAVRCLAATILVWAVTYAIEGGGSPLEIVHNSIAFSQDINGGVGETIQSFAFSTSFAPILRLFQSEIPIYFFLPSRTVDFWSILLPLLIRLGQLAMVLAYAGALIRPDRVHLTRFAGMSVATLLATTDTSGAYALVFLAFLAFLERGDSRASAAIVIIAYVLAISWDIQLTTLMDAYGPSYLANREVFSSPGICLGNFLRPALVLVTQYLFAWLNLRGLLRPAPAPLMMAAAA